MDKKIEETREFLQTIGMPKAQQADICCYVILAMAAVNPLWNGLHETIHGMRKIVEKRLGSRLCTDSERQP